MAQENVKASGNSLISIIVPAYCVEKYLKHCLDSLCAQTYDNIEILVVISPSSDRTEEIAQECALKDKRICLLKGDVLGVSASRNLALDNASGEYIAFVDADDYVEKDYIEVLHRLIRDGQMSVCGFDRVKNNIGKEEKLGADQTYDREELIRDVLCDNRVGGYLWNKLFLGEIIKRQEIRFDTELSVGEDMVFIINYARYIKNGFYGNQILYHYRYNENSALQKMYTTGTFEKKKLSNMQAAQKIQDMLKDEERTVRKAVSYRVVRTGMWTLFNLLKCKHFSADILREIQKSIKGNLFAYCMNKNAKMVEKIVAVCVRFCPEGFWHVATFSLEQLPEEMIQNYVN